MSRLSYLYLPGRRSALRRTLWRLLAGRDAVAVVEFAAMAPIFLLFTALIVDIGYAYNTQLRVIAATGAAAQYAFANGKSVNASTLATFLANVRTAALAQSGLTPTPTITVKFNNAADASNLGNFYCLSGYPASWTSTGSSSAACADNTMSGKFVTIKVEGTSPVVLSPFGLDSSPIATADQAIVRVQ